jgi:beta-glucosidase
VIANITGAGGWTAALAQAQAFLASMNLTEKASLLTGSSSPCVGGIAPIPRLGFNGLCLEDGPTSIRVADYASVFPAGLTTAASFDKSLIYQRGVALGGEFKAKGANLILG